MSDNFSGKWRIGKLKHINSSKHGQIGETATWIVATVIIFVVLFFAVFSSSLLAKGTKITHLSELDSAELQSYALISVLLSSQNGEIIFQNLKEGKNVEENLRKAEEILNEVYGGNLILDTSLYSIGALDGKLLAEIKLNREDTLYLLDKGEF